MIVYEKLLEDFLQDIDARIIAIEIERAFKLKGLGEVKHNEYYTWVNTLTYMAEVLRESGIPLECNVYIEYSFNPMRRSRIDFMLSGIDQHGQENIVLIELKQWSEVEVDDSSNQVKFNRHVTSHPSYQVLSYQNYLTEFNEYIIDNAVQVSSCVYLHNYVLDNKAIFDQRYNDIINLAPVYTFGDKPKLAKFIAEKVGYGIAPKLMMKIDRSPNIVINLLDSSTVYKLLNNENPFILMNDQNVIFEHIKMSVSKTQKNKHTKIISAGPGTGKSLISIRLLGHFLSLNKKVLFVTPNSAFRDIIIKQIAKSGKTQKSVKEYIKSTYSLNNVRKNEYDVIIVDEAHQLLDSGNAFYRGENQITDIVNAAKTSVFFLDNEQQTRVAHSGSDENITAIAKEQGSKARRMELNAQYRCMGGEEYINWVDRVMQLSEVKLNTKWDTEKFELRVYDDPNCLYKKIMEKNTEGFNARMVAGFAWKWSDTKTNPNSNIDDVAIQEWSFSMPWNSRKGRTTWAIRPEGVHEIGCIHTSTGLEFDYVGLFIGYDLKYDSVNKKLVADKNEYKDSAGKRNTKDDIETLTKFIKRNYRILMTRAVKGLYIFCRDKELNEYIKSSLDINNDK